MSNKISFDLKVAIVGCGNIAKMHFKYITKYLPKEHIALCDKDGLRLEDFAKNMDVKNKFNCLEKMLHEFQPDVVHILTPPLTHKDIAIRCLENNCHILIEKPMCVSTKEAEEIITAASAKRRLVCVDHMRIFDPLVIKAKRILDSGKIGKIVNVSAGFGYDYLKRINTDTAARWINNLPGGSFFDVMPHPLCLLEEFLPDLKVERSVYWINKDNVITDLWSVFKSSAGTGALHMTLNVFPLNNYVVFECTKGILTIDFRNFLIIIRRLYNLPNAVERIIGNLSVGIQVLKGTLESMYNFIFGKLDSYSGMDCIIRKFYNAIVNNGTSPVPPEKGEVLLKLTEKIYSEKESDEKKKDIRNTQLGKTDVLVTGGTGFIGRRLVNKLLEKGYKVRILTHRNLTGEEISAIFKGTVEVINADIYNYNDVEKACRGVKAVYHLAAAMKGDWNYHLDTTITGTKNMVKAADEMGVSHFIYVSTLNVYNAKKYPQDGIINEEFPYEDLPEKRGNYSHAKLRAEEIVRKFTAKNGLKISILRPGLVYGPGGPIFLKDVGIRVGKKLVVVLGSGKRRLPLVYVDNLVEALLISLELKEIVNGIFNIVDGDYPTQLGFIKIYKKLSKEKFFTVYIPMWLIFVGFWIIERLVAIVSKKPLSLRYKLRCINKNVKHSTLRIKESLGWNQRVDFEEGLKLTLQANN